VRDTFLRGFGASLTWWLCLIVILLSTIIFEFGIQSLRAAYLTTDEDVFQALEKDPAVKRRFEEASANELQQGWDRKTNKEKDEEERVRETVEKVLERDQERREREVKDLLRKRGDGEVREDDGGDVDRVLSRGFGNVR
jgi:phospholipid-translocating ATPase